MTSGSQQFLPWIFPRLLGGVYFIAFGSLLIQLPGLYGSRGILPITLYLKEFRKALGKKAFRICPTVFWLNCSDRALGGVCLLGVVLSVALMAGGPAVPLLLALWILYLSFVSTGQEFLSYQWDILLLEVGFMTIFLPLAAPSPPIVVFAYRFFLFRFMFSSGAVKILSGDETWRNFTAMTYHYWTQPLPNRVGWFAHHLPVNVQKLSTFMTLMLELVVPALAIVPAPGRLAGFVLLVLFQVLVFVTGSYGFFNILTVVMTVPLLDDTLLAPYFMIPTTQIHPTMSSVVSFIFALFLALNIFQLLALLYRPYWMRRIFAYLSPFMISNHYGLFAVMTSDRLEFELEGSRDGKEWIAYQFRFKPGKLERAPVQAAPHQPRLDWQMWFAALNPRTIEPWLGSLIVRVLEGSPPVLKLFRHNPFPEVPPAYLRLTVYRYRFTTIKEKRKKGQWWERTLVARYKPMMLKSENSKVGGE